MSDYSTAPQGKDPQLWELAQRRASFKKHLAIYIIVNLFLWGVWFFSNKEFDDNRFPWPVWPTLGWGIGLAFHYIGAYVSPKDNSVEKEYQKLMDEQIKKQ